MTIRLLILRFCWYKKAHLCHIGHGFLKFFLIRLNSLLASDRIAQLEHKDLDPKVSGSIPLCTTISSSNIICLLVYVFTTEKSTIGASDAGERDKIDYTVLIQWNTL